MAKSGPQRYPGASATYWYGSKYPGSAMESNVIVWHTTEGTSLPSYGGGAEAPNFTAKPDFSAKRLVWYQHFEFDVSSRALVNKAGGVETNTLNACQVEIVGTCDPATHTKWSRAGYTHLYTPELPDWAIRDLAAFAKWAHDQHGVPLSSGLAFKAYPSSYGNSSVRMTGSQWNAFKGHCGHQHVPENDHGDPGALPITAILATAKGDTTTPAQEDDVPHTIGRYETADRPLVPGKWTTIPIEGVDLLSGATAYQAMAQLTAELPDGATLQGRFYHYRTDGSRWTAGLSERQGTAGSTFADFHNSGSIGAAEKLRFEACYWPVEADDQRAITITTSRLRGLYWK
ncbi:hypothetical protein ACFYO9_34135 [Streptomyces sp. NPDC005863]|uniref:hypothetical protein n=1 Tax=Streptomyces sp. NPDC005863 TaxID=3364735 RepID=UPI0036943BA3